MFVKNELGNKVYVWTQGGGKESQKEGAIISSHGGQAIFNGEFSVPDGVTLHFYAPHGYALQDPSLFSVILGKATVNETVKGPKKFADYKLHKYQGSHGNESENYESIGLLGMTDQELIDAGFSRQQLESRDKPLPLDVITIRNRNMRVSPMLSDVLNLLQTNGWNYKTIHCSFCRCPQMKNETGTWDALKGQAV